MILIAMVMDYFFRTCHKQTLVVIWNGNCKTKKDIRRWMFWYTGLLQEKKPWIIRERWLSYPTSCQRYALLIIEVYGRWLYLNCSHIDTTGMFLRKDLWRFYLAIMYLARPLLMKFPLTSFFTPCPACKTSTSANTLCLKSTKQ